MSSEQDSVSEKEKACAAVHLAFEELGFGVHSLGAAVVENGCHGGVYGVSVLVEASGERVQVR